MNKVSTGELHDSIQDWDREIEATGSIDSQEVIARRNYLQEQVREAYGYIHYIDSV